MKKITLLFLGIFVFTRTSAALLINEPGPCPPVTLKNCPEPSPKESSRNEQKKETNRAYQMQAITPERIKLIVPFTKHKRNGRF